jgi:hypothetical protein
MNARAPPAQNAERRAHLSASLRYRRAAQRSPRPARPVAD